MLRSDLCDYRDAYIVVKRTITVEVDDDDDDDDDDDNDDDDDDKKRDKRLSFKNNTSFRS